MLLPEITPSMIYPACEILENAINRLMFFWRIANILASVIDTMIIQNNTSCQLATIGTNTLINIVISTNAAEPFDTTLRYPVTGVGDPSYTSAVQRWKGTNDSLKPIPAKKNTKAAIWSILPFM